MPLNKIAGLQCSLNRWLITRVNKIFAGAITSPGVSVVKSSAFIEEEAMRIELMDLYW